MFKILQRYIIRESFPPFLIAFFGFNGIILTGRMLNLADVLIAGNVSFLTLIELILSLLPSFLVITLPMSFFLAVIVSFQRMASDSELIAFHSNGVGILKMLPPVLTVALIVSFVSLVNGLYLMPLSNQNIKVLLGENINIAAQSTLTPGVFNDRIPGLVILCQNYSEAKREMSGIIIHDLRNSIKPVTLFSDTGSIEPLESSSGIAMTLKNGEVHQSEKNGLYRIISFEKYETKILFPSTKQSALSDTEMTAGQLINFISKNRYDREKVKDAELQLHKTIAFSFSPLIFSLIAVSLGNVGSRSGKGGGFMLSLLFFLTYYMTYSLAKIMWQKELVSAAFAGWASDVLFLFLALILFWYKNPGEMRELFTRNSLRTHK